MSYIRSLRQILEDKSPSLDKRLVRIKNMAERLLVFTVSKFPYWTPHDFHHSRNVEENLNWIINDDVKEKLHPYEIFFLIVAAWFHDWGMIGKLDEDPEDIRENHHIRTQKYFEELYKEVFLDFHEARIIGLLCRGHRKDDLSDERYRDLLFGASIPIRVRFLSSCLRIADECDITENRTPEIIYYTLNPSDDAEEHFKKHLSIGGVGRPNTERHKIVITGISWDPKGVVVLENVKEKIQNELNIVKNYLSLEGIVLDYTELDITTRGFINEPIEFKLHRNKIFELLIGKNLYSRIDCSIREALQNAIDSCRLKKVFNSEYDPGISIYQKNDEITIEDNGMGMNFEDAFNFLSTKGFSFYNSDEFKKIIGDRSFSPISKFGIGVLSYFMIADQISIESKKEDCSPCKFIIDNISQGWRYEESTKSTEGTSIKFKLNEAGKSLDLEQSLIYYVRQVEIPIKISINDNEYFLEQEWNEEMELIRGVIQFRLLATPGHDFKVSDYVINIKNYSSEEYDITFYCISDAINITLSGKNIFICNKGIFVNSFNLVNAFSPNWFALLNIKKMDVDLSVSRESIIKNEKYYHMLDKIYDAFIIYLKSLIPDSIDINSLFYCTKYNELIEKFCKPIIMSESGDSEKLYTKLMYSKIYPVYDGTEIKLLSGNSIFTSDMVIFLLDLNKEINSLNNIIPYIKQIIEDEKIVFYDGIIYSYKNKKDNKFYSIFDSLSKKHGINIKIKTLLNILIHLDYEIIKTPLNDIIPSNFHFINTQKIFRNLIFYKEMPILTHSEYGDKFFIGAEREIFYLINYYSAQPIDLITLKVLHNIRLEREPVYYIDINNAFIQYVINRFEDIRSNAVLLDLLKTLLINLVIVSSTFKLDLEVIEEWAEIMRVESLIHKHLDGELEYVSIYETMSESISKLINSKIPDRRLFTYLSEIDIK